MLDTRSLIFWWLDLPDFTNLLSRVRYEELAVLCVDVITEKLAICHCDIVDDLNLGIVCTWVKALVHQKVSAVITTGRCGCSCRSRLWGCGSGGSRFLSCRSYYAKEERHAHEEQNGHPHSGKHFWDNSSGLDGMQTECIWLTFSSFISEAQYYLIVSNVIANWQ